MKIRETLLFLFTLLVSLSCTASAQGDRHWRVFNESDGLPDNSCVSVTIGASGNAVVRHAKTNVVSLLDGYEITIIPAPVTDQKRVYESPGGQLWAASREGLFEFRNGKWTLHRVEKIQKHFAEGGTNEIPLLPVRQGRVLILMPDSLLQLDAEDAQQVSIAELRRAEQTSLGSFTTMTLSRDGGLWISGSRGTAKIAGPLRNLKINDPWTMTNAMPDELQNPLHDGSIPDEIPRGSIFDVALGLDGTLWLATPNGLSRRASTIWESAGSNLGDLPAADRGHTLALPDEIAAYAKWQAFFAARNGDLWLGGENHVALRHRDNWRFFSSTNQIGPEDVKAFAEAPDGRIWCATPGKVWEFDGKHWLMLHAGFDHINGLCSARNGILWVATDNGIHRFVRSSWIENGTEDGLPSDVVREVFETKSGEVVAITQYGRCVFRPDADSDPPQAFVRPLGDGANSFREGVPVKLSFGGRDKWKVTSANRLLFSHRLDEREWSPFQELGEVFFTDLSVGRHYFQVRAMDRNGNISPAPARMEFVVALPWFKETRIVVILSGALVVALFFAGVAFNRHRQLLRSYAVVEEEIAARTRELEIANRELLHSQKMNALGTLAAGIAHDFNNILSIIKGSAQIIEENPDNPEKTQTRISRIKTMVEQGAGIVNAMLGFSSNNGEQPASCDLNIVVQDTIKLLGDRFLREVEIQFESAPDLPPVPAARDLVQQILLNFIFNAAEAMTANKQIILATVRLERLPADLFLKPALARSYVSVSVRDSGAGVPQENLSRIFEPFFTTKALSTRRGTGLGLSMVYELAKKLEAGLAVQSVVGEGSTFTLILPVREAQQDQIQESA